MVSLAVIAALLGGGGFLVWRHFHPGADPGAFGMREVSFELHSKLLGQSLEEVGVMPPPLPDGRRRPLLVFLHGRGGTPESMATDQLFAALKAAGDLAPDVILANGGDQSYFHDRSDGPWGLYIIQEVIPAAIQRLNADRHRVAIGGVSMGGFGALDLARLWPHRFCAAGGHSAAIWRTGGETPAGAFDNAEDFARHDLFASVQQTPDLYGHMPVWMDVGTKDPFRRADTSFVGLLRRGGNHITFHVWPGSHNGAYWASHMTQYLAFYSNVLAHCH